MDLRGKYFGPIFDAAGTRGFFGRGYPFHRLPLVSSWYKPLGKHGVYSAFVTKTIVVRRRVGNMKLMGPEQDFEPVDLFPDCIWVNPWSGLVVNSVSLSGPGLEEILRYGVDDRRWYHVGYNNLPKPFMASFMPEGNTGEERLADTRAFVTSLQAKLKLEMNKWLKQTLGVQFNFTCRNAGVNLNDLMAEAGSHFDILGELEAPVMAKLNLSVSVEEAREIANHPACDAICIGSAIPFGELPDRIPWEKLFPEGSPIERRNPAYGKGMLSGVLLLPIAIEWVERAISTGFPKPINAGGGIVYEEDVGALVSAGLRPGIDAVSVGTATMLRPWNLDGIVHNAHYTLRLTEKPKAITPKPILKKPLRVRAMVRR